MFISNMRKIILSLALCFGVLIGVPEAVAHDYPGHSVLSGGTWYKMAIEQAGVYRLTTTTVSALRGVAIDNIGVFGRPGGMLSEDNYDYRPNDLAELPIEIVDKNHNNRFDDEDYLLFYADGADKWSYDDASQRIVHQRNGYANYNYCFLTTTNSHQRRLTTVTPSGTPSGSIDSLTAVSLINNDLVNIFGSGRTWMGEKFSAAQSSRTFSITIPGLTTGTPLSTRYAWAGVSTQPAKFKIACGGRSYTDSIVPSNRYHTFSGEFPASGSTSTFNLNFYPTESTAAGYLDFIEVNALVTSTFQSGSQRILYNTQHIGPDAVYNYHVINAPQSMRVWDVTRCDSVFEHPVTFAGTRATYAAAPTKVRSYLFFDGTNYLAPKSVEYLPNQDLHAIPNPDMVIVTHPNYVGQSKRLANLHEVMDGLSVAVVTDQQVYNEFSSGRQDPMAIREFLRMFYYRAQEYTSMPAPRYLLLFGKGTYDNRNLLGFNQTTVVTFQSTRSDDDQGGSYGSDNFMAYLRDEVSPSQAQTSGLKVDVGIGRLPAKSVDEANLLVDKIEGYMMRRDLMREDLSGDWRNKVVLLADDADPGRSGDKCFAVDAEALADSIKSQYPSINIDRIYADAYPQQSGAIGSFYPDVNNAINQHMNNGCLMLNYIGHGSEYYIGTERFMELQDMSKYANSDRLAFFITSTCSFGHFDLANDICGAEGFLLSPNAGIAVISAARPISHSRFFNIAVCTNALDPELTIGDALRQARNEFGYYQCVVLLGDPALKLSLPQEQVVVTRINGRDVADGQPDSAQVLSQVTVEGEVRDAEGNRIEDFDGELYPIVFDRPVKCRTLANDNEGTEVDFEQQKSVLYKGRERVRQGRFTYQFTIPRDVAYDFGACKMSHYAKSGSLDAVGYYNNLYLGGFDTSVDLSEHRPIIRLYLNDSTFRNGGIASESPSLFAILEDSVGINAVGSGLGHDITAVLDNNPNSLFVLNDFYTTDVTNPRRGTILYDLKNLSSGSHTLTLKAWNIYNYSSTATLQFYVTHSGRIVLDNLSAYPNPTRGKVLIRAEHNGLGTIRSALFQIFDRNGQMVREITPDVDANSYVVSAPWDLCNQSGAQVADGVYMVRLILDTSDGDRHVQTTRVVKLK